MPSVISTAGERLDYEYLHLRTKTWGGEREKAGDRISRNKSTINNTVGWVLLHVSELAFSSDCVDVLRVFD